jgi:DNA-binding NarL/FixJ family response regulator
MIAMKCGVFVLSCNRIVRESIERLIRKRADLDLLGAQSAHADSVNSVIESGAEVLLVDSLPFVLEPNGWRAAPQAERQRVKVVLIAMSEDKKLFLSAVKHGVTGYVLQDSPSIDVINAIRTAASGQSVCPPHFTRVLFDFVSCQAAELPNAHMRQRWGLSRREQQLIPLIGRGMTNKAIAAEFNLSEQTVKNHVHRMLRKVGVGDRCGIFEAWQARADSLL